MARRKSNSSGGDFCSFCYKSSREVGRLLGGPASVNICSECVQVCSDILNAHPQAEGDAKTPTNRSEKTSPPSPREIHQALDDYVIGHDDTKRMLAVAVYSHYQRISQPKGNDTELEKSNILLLGDTGTGKTLLAKTLAKIVNVPFAVADATTLTEAGYVGEDVENILLKLIQAAEGDIARAQKGIIFIDEIDKVSRRSENRSITRDVSGEGVQQALLKILEGTSASVPPHGGRKHPEQQNLRINTEDILFICGGAFDGLPEIIRRRIGSQQIGFVTSEIKANEENDVLKAVEPDDMIKYGLIPELTGRVPVIGVLDKLDKETFMRILIEPKNSIIKQYILQYEMMDIKLEFDKNFLKLIVDQAFVKKLGVRALRGIMEKYMMPLTYLIASYDKDIDHICITPTLLELGAESFFKAQIGPISFAG